MAMMRILTHTYSASHSSLVLDNLRGIPDALQILGRWLDAAAVMLSRRINCSSP